VTPGLGDNSYLIASGGEGAIVDPQRDAGRFLAAAEAHGVAIRYVIETHVHNDYVSGAREIQSATGAAIAAPARGRYQFTIEAMAEGDELKLGDLRLMAMETPGHTPEHTSYLVFESGSEAPTAVFTGGSLMVGSAGRTDLLGSDLTEELTRAQYRSLQRLGALPDDVQILPTHGAGSFCGSGPAQKDRTSTLGSERTRNPAMNAADEVAFVRQQLSGLLAYPTYYASMAPINRAGPGLLAGIRSPTALPPEEVASRQRAGAWVIDGRWRVPFARAHVTGSLNVELDDTFASYVGWVVPFGEPLVLVLPEPEKESLHEAVTQLERIGYERIDGYLDGGMDTWQAAGLPVDSYRVAGLEELCRAYRAGQVPRLLDVRQQTEWDEGRIPGSTHVFVGDLPGRLDDVPTDQEVWVICASGHRHPSPPACWTERTSGFAWSRGPV